MIRPLTLQRYIAAYKSAFPKMGESDYARIGRIAVAIACDFDEEGLSPTDRVIVRACKAAAEENADAEYGICPAIPKLDNWGLISSSPKTMEPVLRFPPNPPEPILCAKTMGKKQVAQM